MTADDRTSSASKLSPSTSGSTGAATQSASFDLGTTRVELAASVGAARLVVGVGDVREVYVVDPVALAEWSRAIERLLTLGPVATERERADYRAPYLIDREGRPSIAVEACVADAVTYRVIVHRTDSPAAGISTSRETIRGLAAAAAGAVSVAAPR